MNVRFFEPGKAYMKIKPEIDAEIQRVLEAGDLILRGDVEKFEKDFAKYIGSKYAVALNSCTDALYLALRVLKIGKGDEVLVPSRTFVATVQTVVQVGATPVYYDLDGVMNITEKTRAIIPVHIEGEFDKHFNEIIALAHEHNLYVIEDAAQALGAETLGKKAGSWGIAGCFSFYPAKILGAYGDAGALVTDNEEVYKYIKDCRNHFKEDARDWGVNSRMDNLQAAVLNVRFKYLPEMLKRRQEIAEMYDEGLRGLPCQLPEQSEGRVYQDYIIRLSSMTRRDHMFAVLKADGIETLKNNYPFPVPKTPLAQDYEDMTLRLPCNDVLTDDEVQYVITNIRKFYAPQQN